MCLGWLGDRSVNRNTAPLRFETTALPMFCVAPDRCMVKPKLTTKMAAESCMRPGVLRLVWIRVSLLYIY